MPDRRGLGVGAYDSATTFHRIEVRNVSGTGTTVASTSKPTGTRPSTRPTNSRPKPTTPTPTRPSTSNGNKKRVLIVIANEGFFYREYADPRQELERAGFEVVVAAARKTSCQPHANSGQSGSGIVQPDIAVANAKSQDYEAIVFSGGWGSSMYQFAFRGSYSNRAYNGDRQTKSTVNRLINEFVEQDKHVAGICHGVSVLAWSRVNNKSLLQGKRVAAPTRPGPAGIYNGRRAQPPSRWNSEVNGARLYPPRSIGNPNSAADDVAVDGKVLTAEDDQSARELGRRLGQLLNASK